MPAGTCSGTDNNGTLAPSKKHPAQSAVLRCRARRARRPSGLGESGRPSGLGESGPPGGHDTDQRS